MDSQDIALDMKDHQTYSISGRLNATSSINCPGEFILEGGFYDQPDAMQVT
jgi:hypothetical protein